MPTPTNVTPETATVIASLPFSVAQEITDAPLGSGYDPDCEGWAPHAVWYAYTPPANIKYIRILPDSLDCGPVVSIWTGTPPSLTQYSIGGQSFCGYMSGGAAFNVPVTPGTTYYIQITDHFNTSPANITLDISASPQVTIPEGSVVIMDAYGGFPAIALDPTDGTVLQALDLPGGEFAASVPTGEWAFGVGNIAGTASLSVQFYDPTLGIVSTYNLPVGESVIAMTSDWSSRFYVASQPLVGAMAATVRQFDLDGTLLDTWTLPTDSVTLFLFAIDRDNTRLYYAAKTVNTPIRTYDLVNEIALGDLVAAASSVFYRQAFVAEDGSVYVLKGTGSLSFLASPEIVHYSTAGAVLDTISVPLTYAHLFAPDRTDGYAWVWGYPATSGNTFAQFKRIALATEVVTDSWTVPVHATSGFEEDTLGGWSISGSCPLLVAPVSIAAPDGVTPPTPVIILPPATPSPAIPFTCGPQALVTGGGLGNAGCNFGGGGVPRPC